MRPTIEKIFGSRVRTKILGWFFMHTDEKFFVRQLSNILNEDSTNLSRELTSLEKAGILSSSKEGNLKYFRVNPMCPFLDELKGLVMKTVGVVGSLKSVLEELPDIKYAFVYGSYARGQENSDSDVDVVVIGNTDLNVLDRAMDEIEKRVGRPVNYAIYDYGEFSSKKKAKDGFITDVLRDRKIMLVGDERELTKT